jgi:hypothetical protein
VAAGAVIAALADLDGVDYGLTQGADDRALTARYAGAHPRAHRGPQRARGRDACFTACLAKDISAVILHTTSQARTCGHTKHSVECFAALQQMRLSAFATCVARRLVRPLVLAWALAPARVGGWGLGFRVWGSGFGVWGFGFGGWDLALQVWGLGVSVWALPARAPVSTRARLLVAQTPLAARLFILGRRARKIRIRLRHGTERPLTSGLVDELHREVQHETRADVQRREACHVTAHELAELAAD